MASDQVYQQREKVARKKKSPKREWGSFLDNLFGKKTLEKAAGKAKPKKKDTGDYKPASDSSMKRLKDEAKK